MVEAENEAEVTAVEEPLVMPDPRAREGSRGYEKVNSHLRLHKNLLWEGGQEGQF